MTDLLPPTSWVVSKTQTGSEPLHVTEMLQLYSRLMQIWTRKDDPPPRFPLSFLMKANVTGRIVPACPFVLKVLIFLYVIICIVYYCCFVFKEKKKSCLTRSFKPCMWPGAKLGLLRSILAKSWQYVHFYKHRFQFTNVWYAPVFLISVFIFAIRDQIRGQEVPRNSVASDSHSMQFTFVLNQRSKQTSNPKTRRSPHVITRKPLGHRSQYIFVMDKTRTTLL